MVEFKLYLLGPPRLKRNDQPIEINLRKAFALLIYLAVTRQAHSRDTLATLFWPEHDQRSARANLRRLLYDLNQLRGEPLLAGAGERLGLQNAVTIWVDIEQFQGYLNDSLRAQPVAEAPNESAYPEAQDRLTAALELCRTYQYDGQARIILGYLGRWALQTGAVEEAGRYFREALQLHERMGGHYQREALLSGLGKVAEAHGDYPTAQHYCEQALLATRESGVLSDVAYALAHLGEITCKLGGYAAARGYLQEALQLHAQIGETFGRACTLDLLGLVAQAEGDAATAVQSHTKSLWLFRRLDMRLGQATALHHLGQVASRTNQRGTAHHYYTHALQIALQIEATPLVLDVLVSLAAALKADQCSESACLSLAFVLHQPTLTYETHCKAQALLKQQAALAPILVAAAHQKAQTMSLTEIIAEVTTNVEQVQ